MLLKRLEIFVVFLLLFPKSFSRRCSMLAWCSHFTASKLWLAKSSSLLCCTFYKTVLRDQMIYKNLCWRLVKDSYSIQILTQLMLICSMKSVNSSRSMNIGWYRFNCCKEPITIRSSQISSNSTRWYKKPVLLESRPGSHYWTANNSASFLRWNQARLWSHWQKNCKNLKF
jgi:hypothetical protein